MDGDSFIGLMDHITKDHTLMMRDMGKGQWYGMWTKDTVETGHMEWDMAMANRLK